jgi:hypothetical protein
MTIKEIQIKTTLTLLEWISSKTQTTTNVGEDVGKKEPSFLLLVGIKLTTTEINIKIPHQTKTTTWSSNTQAYIQRNVSQDTTKTFEHPCLLQYYSQ